MAVVWRRKSGDSIYEVRSAGNSLRLYTNGVFHSQYNQQYPLAGSVWDLLVLPALFYSQNTIGRVLVLGVGAGAVICQLNALVKPKHIVGVELDPIHIDVAQRFFNVNTQRNTTLHAGEARRWVRRYRGPRFDLVIEDLFFDDDDGEPQRAIAADKVWCRQLQELLTPNGALVINFDRAKVLNDSALRQEKQLRREFSTQFQLLTPGYDNRVGAFFRKPVTKQILTQRLRQLEQEYGKPITRRLNAKIRQLKTN